MSDDDTEKNIASLKIGLFANGGGTMEQCETMAKTMMVFASVVKVHKLESLCVIRLPNGAYVSFTSNDFLFRSNSND